MQGWASLPFQFIAHRQKRNVTFFSTGSVQRNSIPITSIRISNQLVTLTLSFPSLVDRETALVCCFIRRFHKFHFPGQKFAILEAKSMLAHIFRRFRVESIDIWPANRPLPEIILKPSNGFKVRIYRRWYSELSPRHEFLYVRPSLDVIILLYLSIR